MAVLQSSVDSVRCPVDNNYLQIDDAAEDAMDAAQLAGEYIAFA